VRDSDRAETPASANAHVEDRWSPEGLRATSPGDLEAVYRAYADDVMNLLLGGFGYPARDRQRHVMRVASHFEAEELCQETFARFFHQCRAGTFDPQRPVKPYLMRIAVNVTLMRRRKLWREVLVDPDDIVAPVAPPSVEDPHFAADLEEFRAGLDPRAEQVFTLAMQHGESQQKLAERLGLSRDQVYRSLVRIRAAAREFFTARGWFK
jgi:RNA polymerase sigma factor (sigma-70 family)